MSYRSVVIPLVAGEDSTSDARGVDAPTNVLVENATFVARTGIRKRHGHVDADIDTSDSPGTYTARADVDGSTVADGIVTPPSDFVYGKGLVPTDYVSSTTFPDMGAGSVVFRNGDQLLAARPGQIRAYTGEIDAAPTWDFPVSTVETTERASRATKQTHADSATVDGLTLHSWIDYATGSPLPMYSIFREDGTPVLVNQSYGTSSPTYVRCLAVPGYLFAVVFYNGTNSATVYRWTTSVVSTPVSYALSSIYRFIDWCAYKDDILIVYGNSTSSEFSLDIRTQSDFAERSNRAPGSAVSFTASGTAGDIVQLATVSAWESPQDVSEDTFALAWTTTDSGGARSSLGFYSVTLAGLDVIGGSEDISGNLDVLMPADYRVKHITCALNQYGESDGSITGHLFCDFYDGSPGNNDSLFGIRYYTGEATYGSSTGVLADTPTVEYSKQLASKCWVVGQKPFVVALHNIDSGIDNGSTGTTPANKVPQFQRSYLVLDENLKPAGQLCYGEAYASQFNAESLAAGNKWLATVDMGSSGNTNSYRKYMSLQFVEKLTDLTATYAAASLVFAEPSVREYMLDFSPQLTSGAYGSSVYFPGAMPWQFDGVSVGEGCFLHFPEFVSLRYAGPGALGSTSYSYQVFAVRKTGRGEIMLSGALPVVVSGTDDTVLLRIRRIPTRYDDVYFKVYRTAGTGSTFYLVSDPDPSSANCPKNPAVGTAYVDFTDSAADGDITSNELSPLTGGVLENLCPPASKYISGTADRVFLHGGEIRNGDIVFSKQVDNYYTAGFNPVLSHVVDRAGDPLTGLVASADMIVATTANTVYAIDNIGPDNLGQGEFQPPRLLNQTHGCISPFSLAVTPIGVVYCSKRGIHILGQTPTHFGWPVTARTEGVEFVGTVSVQSDHQVRFYLSSGNCLVFDYDLKRWSVWTGLGANSVCEYRGRAALLTANGKLLIEDTSAYTDAGSRYLFRVRTGWFQPSVEGRMMVRRVRVVGTVLSTEADARISVYTDDNRAPQTVVNWSPESDSTQNTSGWGEGAWGDGAWGNPDSDMYLDRAVARLSFQLNYPRCTRVSTDIRLDDNTAGLIFTHIIYEFSPSGGLAPTPAKSFT